MSKRSNSSCEDVELYLIGGLTESDKQSFEAHLAACESCQRTLEELSPVIDSLPLEAEPVEPPAGMKSRILAAIAAQAAQDKEEDHDWPASSSNQLKTPSSTRDGKYGLSSDDSRLSPNDGTPEAVRAESRPRSWRLPVVSAAAILLLLASGFLLMRVDHLNEETSKLASRVESLQQQLDSTDRPLTAVQTNHVIALSPTTKDMMAQGLATIIVDDKGMHLIVQAEQLPLLSGEEAFQVWLLKNGSPVNAGTFLTREGTGALYFTFKPDEYDQIAITQEPDANGKEPRGSIVLAGSL